MSKAKDSFKIDPTWNKNKLEKIKNEYNITMNPFTRRISDIVYTLERWSNNSGNKFLYIYKSKIIYSKSQPITHYTYYILDNVGEAREEYIGSVINNEYIVSNHFIQKHIKYPSGFKL